MPLGSPRLKYVGGSAVNAGDLALMVEKAVHLAALTSPGEIPMTVVQSSKPVLSLYSVGIVFAAAVASGTAFTINLNDRTAGTVVASLVTGAATIPAYTETLFTLGPGTINPGDVLTISVSGTGTMPACCVIPRFVQ
jgi:hypothetical protein